MIYHLKTDNFKTFSVYKDNVLQPRSYFIPFGSEKALMKTDIRTERYASDRVTVLSGEWDFIYCEKGSLLPKKLNTDSVSFDKVAVPSCWQFTGYEAPCYINSRYQFKPSPPEFPTNCAVGVYRRYFTVTDMKKHYTLSFLGVAGALDVFVNGQYVGYSEGSHNTSDFELDAFLTEGENELVAVVHKFSNGTYLECQDMFRNNGIFRDVLLYETGDNSIYDFELKTAYNGCYSLTVLPSFKLTEECTFTVSIEELSLSKSVNVSPESIEAITFDSLDAEEWSAEIPKLYTVLLSLSKDGKIIEIIRKHIGFRHIEIEGNVFYFNRKKIKLLGVNHHDTDPKKGYVMSVEDMERDIAICKEYHCNCIRTSHYPPDPVFLDLCDAYGIYVIDEADIETHGVMSTPHPGACSHNPKWQGHYWDRVYRMFERDKNHPCITMWSLGNESWGYKNHDYCYEQLKKLSAIPIHYEGVVRTRRFAYDVISQMYPWQRKMRMLASGKGLSSKWYAKPYFLCEYAHAMGVGAGELETYIRCFYQADNMLGGCIWEFADHAVEHENGPLRYTYGGDHHEKKHDGNFCVDGLFYPDRTPHAGALQMKNCYRPVRGEKQGDDFVFTNLNYFRSVAYHVKWEGSDGARMTESGSFELKLQPRESVTVNLNEQPDTEYFVFRYFDGDTEIASEYHGANGYPAIEAKAEKPLETAIEVGGDSIVLTLNGTKAVLGATLFRAPLDNDMHLKKAWEPFKLSSERLQILKKTEKGNTLTVEAAIKNKKSRTLAGVVFVIKREENALEVKLSCQKALPIPFTPRFGLTVQLPREYENVCYFGLGERQNLPDFREHAMLGEYAMKVDEMRERYIKPQESSMRCGVRWSSLTDANGNGFRYEGKKKPFIFSADHFTSQQCADAMHQEELALQDFTYLHFDSYQLGAASGACGPPPTKDYRKNCVKGECVALRITSV